MVLNKTEQLFRGIQQYQPPEEERQHYANIWGECAQKRPYLYESNGRGLKPNIVSLAIGGAGRGCIFPGLIDRYLLYMASQAFHADGAGSTAVVLERFCRGEGRSSVALFDLDVEFAGTWTVPTRASGCPRFRPGNLTEIYTLIQPLLRVIQLVFANPGDAIVCARAPTSNGEKKKMGIHIAFPSISMDSKSQRLVELLLSWSLTNGALQTRVSDSMVITNWQSTNGKGAFMDVFDIRLDSLRSLGSAKSHDPAKRGVYSIVEWLTCGEGGWAPTAGVEGTVNSIFSSVHDAASEDEKKQIIANRVEMLRHFCAFVDRGRATETNDITREMLGDLVDMDVDEAKDVPSFGGDGVVVVPERRSCGGGGVDGLVVVPRTIKVVNDDGTEEEKVNKKWLILDAIFRQVVGEMYIKHSNVQGQSRLQFYQPDPNGENKNDNMFAMRANKGGVCCFVKDEIRFMRRDRFHYHESNRTTFTVVPGFVCFHCPHCSGDRGSLFFPISSLTLSQELFGMLPPRPAITRHYCNTTRTSVDKLLVSMTRIKMQHKRETSEKRMSLSDLVKDSLYNIV